MMAQLRHGRRWPGTAQRQRGAVAVFVAAGLVALVASLLFVIDIGRLYYAQRQLQLDANMAALAGAQAGAGCLTDSNGVPGDQTAITNAVLQSLRNNTPGLGVTGGSSNSIAYLGTPATPLFETGNAFSAASLSAVQGTLVSAVEVGQTVLSSDGVTRTLKPLAIGDPNINSVRVTLAAAQPHSFLMGFMNGGNSTKVLHASATAQQQALGSFYLGTGLLNLSGGVLNQVLGGLLCARGDSVCQSKILALNLASFNGLANVGISLGQLAIATGLRVKDLTDPAEIQTKTPILSDVLNSLAGQLVGNVADPTVITTLRSLATAVQGNTAPIPLGLILQPVGTAAANVPFVNLQQLVVGLGEATHVDPNNPGQVTPIQLPVNLDVPGVATVAAFVSVGAPPVFSGLVPAGSPQATSKTAEIVLHVRIAAGQLLTGIVSGINGVLNGILNLVGGVLGLKVNITAAPGPLNLGVDVGVASASATLDSLQCPAAGHGPVANLTATPAIATVEVGTFSGAPSANPVLDPGKTNFDLANVYIDASKVCVGLNVLGLCIGLPVNLGKTGVALGLEFTSVGVGGTGPQSLDPVDQFKLCSDPTKDPLCGNGAGIVSPTYFLANGAPQAPAANPTTENPQTIGSPADVQLNLGLTNKQTGGGLVGDLGGLVNSLLTGVKGLIQPLVNLVNGLATSLINPLLQTLGIQLGTATVTMNTAAIGQPLVVTNCLPNVTGPDNCLPPDTPQP